MILPLYGLPNAQCSPADFGAILMHDRLGLPENVWRALQRLSVGEADRFVNVLFEAPGVVAEELGWSIDQVAQGRDRLVALLEGKVDASLLHPSAPVDHGFGALAP